ncbi:MAG: hypothetical protein M3Z25_08230 [Actinomycetota bacterium]|nr:hypothetical protein [Actinomycetota bacterium]
MTDLDPRWYDYARRDQPHFDATVYLEQVVRDPEHLSGLVDDAIRTAVGHAPGSLRIRAFRDRAFDYQATAALVTSTVGQGERSHEWLSRVVGDTESCIAVNGVSAWSLPLSRWAREAVNSLLGGGAYTLPSGADVYTFVAGSGWTPFGVHRDSEPSLLFHLGPGKKETWVWPVDTLQPDEGFWRNPSFGSPLSFDFDRHLDAAYHVTLEPGDFISIPKHAFHVFRNVGLSAFVGIALYPAKTEALLRAAIGSAVLERADLGEDLGAGRLELDHALGRFSAIDDLRRAVRDQLDRAELLKRTAGYLDEINPVVTRRTVLDTGATLRWEFPGIVGVRRCGSSTELVTRGRPVRYAADLDFTALTRMTAERPCFSYDELSDALPRELSTRDRERTIQHMHLSGAFSPS